MNLQNNFTRLDKNLKEVLEKWDKKILPFLPECLDGLARKTGAVQRKRGVCSASCLLKMLFLYACSNISFRILAAAAYALGISDISDTSWRKHFSKSSCFLYEILHFLLSSFLSKPDMSGFEKTKNVLLVDASVVRQNGKKQEQQRIHMCYSLNQDRMYEVKVTDKHTAESLTHFSLKKDDLVMADAGYGTAHNYIYAQEHQADVILRITPKNFCLYDTDGNKISLVQLLKEAEKRQEKMVDVFGFCKYRTKTAFGRIIAGKLPEGQAEKARKRKKRTAVRKQKQITGDTLFCAGWMVVITSLGAGYCGEEILHLYRSRWQVELLFKRFKQNFSVTSLKSGNKNYAETEALLWLIIWAISERQLFLAECFLAGKGETVNCSLYEKCKISFLKIKEILCLPWAQFINFTDKKYSRYLSRKKLYRKNQNNGFHTAILPGLLA